eukprot:SAG11_NODE_20491_length_444_cov_0.837681_1_plen_72_part_00
MEPQSPVANPPSPAVTPTRSPGMDESSYDFNVSSLENVFIGISGMIGAHHYRHYHRRRRHHRATRDRRAKV